MRVSLVSDFKSTVRFSIAGITGYKTKYEPAWCIPSGNPNHPEVAQIREAVMSGMRLVHLIEMYTSQLLAPQRETSPIALVRSVIKLSSPIVFRTPRPINVEGKWTVVHEPITFDLPETKIEVKIARSVVVSTVINKSDKKVTVSKPQLMTACRLVAASVRLEKGVVKANVGALPPASASFDHYLTEVSKSYTTIYTNLKEVVEGIVKDESFFPRDCSMSGVVFADTLYKCIEKSPLVVGITAVVYNSLPLYSPGKGGYTFSTKSITCPVDTDGRQGMISVRTPTTFVAPPVGRCSLNSRFFHSWSYVLDQCRLLRGKDEEGQSDLSLDYFTGYSFPKSTVSYSVRANDILNAIGESRLLLIKRARDGVTLDEAITFGALAYSRGGDVSEDDPTQVYYFTQERVTKRFPGLTITDTLPKSFADMVVYEGEYLKASHKSDSAVSVKRVESFMRARIKWSDAVTQRVTDWRAARTGKAIAYADAAYAYLHDDYAVCSQLHQGYVLVTHNVKLGKPMVQTLSREGIKEDVECNYKLLDWSIQFANLVRCWYPMYGQTYQDYALQALQPNDAVILPEIDYVTAGERANYVQASDMFTMMTEGGAVNISPDEVDDHVRRIIVGDPRPPVYSSDSSSMAGNVPVVVALPAVKPRPVDESVVNLSDELGGDDLFGDST